MIIINSTFIKRDELLIAAVTGDGKKTCELWEDFCTKKEEHGIKNTLSDHGYEVRIYHETYCECHVGALVSSFEGNEPFTALRLPSSEYVVFEVQVAKGYDSQNEAIDRWLRDNLENYKQKKLKGRPYIIEYYGERFKGDSLDSMVDLWVPISKEQ